MTQLLKVCPYNVGDIYLTTLSANPSDIWDNTTWEKIEGRFLLASDSTRAAGSTGGADTHSHTTDGHALTTDELPSHAHGNTIKATTPQLAHSITQPVFKYTAPASHSHGLNAGWVALESSYGEGIVMDSKTNVSWTPTWQNKFTSSGTGSYSAKQTSGAKLLGTTDAAACSGTANGATASRTTNVGVAAHAASACTMSGEVTATGGVFSFARRYRRFVVHSAVPRDQRLEAHGVRSAA